jgi:hypothetical protein
LSKVTVSSFVNLLLSIFVLYIFRISSGDGDWWSFLAQRFCLIGGAFGVSEAYVKMLDLGKELCKSTNLIRIVLRSILAMMAEEALSIEGISHYIGAPNIRIGNGIPPKLGVRDVVELQLLDLDSLNL